MKNSDTILNELPEIIDFDDNLKLSNNQNKNIKKYHKTIIISMIVVFIVFICLGTFIYLKTWKLDIKDIKLLKYNPNDKTIDIKIEKKSFLLDHNFNCTIASEHTTLSNNGKNNACYLTVPIGEKYKLFLENKFNKSISYNLNDYINTNLSFDFIYDTVYLTIGEKDKILYEDVSLDGEKINYNFYSDNNAIVNVINGNIIGVSKGTATIHEPLSRRKLNVVVTDLITKPIYVKEKVTVPCNQYSEEDNNILDRFLEYDVQKAGYQTRAGAVAAARFLTLRFPYRIPYFYENGRLNDSGVNYADGEGRYYHKGLYLNTSRFSSIIKAFSGPAIWGCPLYNWEDEHWFGFYEGVKRPNGLDCSGFVSWALVNGGFDPGDIGAGETEEKYQLTDLGEFKPLTDDILSSVKAGDLFNYFGHISIIIGIKDDIYYVAESLPNFYGVDVRIYTKEKLLNTFTYVVLMDSYYQDDGNYTAFWE